MFRDFISNSINIDIYSTKYEYFGNSKANRLRQLWKTESNHIVSKLILDLAGYWEHFYKHTLNWSDAYDDDKSYCLNIAKKLGLGLSECIKELIPNNNDEDFHKLAQSIRAGLESNEPETEVDRLHTFLGKYFRVLCDKHNISYDNSKPLNSIFGEYVKHLKRTGIIESEMTLTILSVTVSVLERFNNVRNTKSFAHPNPLLNYEESLLIFKHVSATVKFINSVERELLPAPIN